MTEGVVAVVARDGRYLVVRRSNVVAAPGAWCFVGGAIEPGESEPDALVREFREEVGGQISPLRRVWEYVHPDGGLRLYWWSATLLEDDLCPNETEVAELRWCSPAEILALPGLLPSNREFLRAIARTQGEGV
jgi:8-oxo-dGTP diphosphatase